MTTAFFGIALATIVSGAVGIFVFGGLGVAVAPVLIYHIMGYTERMAIVLSKVPTSDSSCYDAWYWYWF